MPQMHPLFWLSLFTLTSLIFMSTISMIYFKMEKKLNKIEQTKISMKHMNWKW